MTLLYAQQRRWITHAEQRRSVDHDGRRRRRYSVRLDDSAQM